MFEKIIKIDRENWRFTKILGIRIGLRFRLGRFWKPSWMKYKFVKASLFGYFHVYYDEENGLDFWGLECALFWRGFDFFLW